MKHNETLTINVFYENEIFELKTYPGEYRSLMALISDKMDVESFGECKGMGRCSTCMAEIIYSKNLLPKSPGVEETTLNKAGNVNPKIRLTCQLPINNRLQHIEIKLCSE